MSMTFDRTLSGVVHHGKLCGVDFDDMFALQAFKTVKIRDRKLGLLNCFISLLIAVYVLVFEVGFNNQYLAYYSVLPSIRLTFQQPTVNVCNPTSNSCLDILQDESMLPYCNTSEGGCTFMDGFSAGLISGAQILMPTLIQSSIQNKNLTSVSGGLTKLWVREDDNLSASYLAGITDYTIGFDHSITEPKMGLSLLTTQMQGKLYVDDRGPLQQRLCNERQGAVTKPVDGVLTNTAPCYIDPDYVLNGIDIFKVSTILAAVNVDLDVDNYGSATDTFRSRGFTITMGVHYYNVWPYRMGAIGGLDYEKIDYIYTPSLLRAPLKTSTIVWLNYPVKRALLNINGVLLTMASSSAIGAPEFQALLLTLTSSVACLAVSGALVNIVAVYVLRFRPYYAAMLTDTSPDFSDVCVLESKSTDELRNIFIDERMKADMERRHLVLRILSLRQEAQEALIEAMKEKIEKRRGSTENPIILNSVEDLQVGPELSNIRYMSE